MHPAVPVPMTCLGLERPIGRRCVAVLEQHRGQTKLRLLALEVDLRTSVFVPGALSVLDAAIEGAIEDGQPFVTHCSGGGGRVSIMLSLWLHRKHGLSAEAAAAMIEETAKDAGTRRAPNPSKLVALLEAGQL